MNRLKCYDYYCRPVFIIPFESVLEFPASKSIDSNITLIISFLVMGTTYHIFFKKQVIFERTFPERGEGRLLNLQMKLSEDSEKISSNNLVTG